MREVVRIPPRGRDPFSRPDRAIEPPEPLDRFRAGAFGSQDQSTRRRGRQLLQRVDDVRALSRVPLVELPQKAGGLRRGGPEEVRPDRIRLAASGQIEPPAVERDRFGKTGEGIERPLEEKAQRLDASRAVSRDRAEPVQCLRVQVVDGEQHAGGPDVLDEGEKRVGRAQAGLAEDLPPRRETQRKRHGPVPRRDHDLFTGAQLRQENRDRNSDRGEEPAAGKGLGIAPALRRPRARRAPFDFDPEPRQGAPGMLFVLLRRRRENGPRAELPPPAAEIPDELDDGPASLDVGPSRLRLSFEEQDLVNVPEERGRRTIGVEPEEPADRSRPARHVHRISGGDSEDAPEKSGERDEEEAKGCRAAPRRHRTIRTRTCRRPRRT